MKHWIRTALWWAMAATCFGHVVSLSNGELEIHERTAEYTLHMPAYEVEHVADPETALLKEVRFGDGRLMRSDCARTSEDFVCHASYEFDHDLPDKVEVECTLYRATVPNHIHMLYARQGSNADQRVFDQNTSVIELRFHPPSMWESLTRDGSAGAKRFVTSVAGLLFVMVIALAARTRREALALGALFFAAEWITRPIAPFLPVGLSAEFLEAVMALSAAYIAGELLFLPGGNARWIAVPLFGLLHGMPFVAFPPLYLAGAQLAQGALLGMLTVGALKLPKAGKRVATAVCLAAALSWFAHFVL